MTTRATSVAVVCAMAIVAGCSGQSPVSPDSFGSGAASSTSASGPVTLALSKGKPVPNQGIGQVTFVNSLGLYTRVPTDPDQGNPLSGGIDSTLFQLTGTVSGSTPARIIRATGSGTGTMTVHDVVPDQVPFNGNCRETDMRDAGLVGPSLSGALTNLQVDEGERTVAFSFDFSPATGPYQGQSWHVGGYSSNNFRATIQWSGQSVSVVQNYGEIGFGQNGKGRNTVQFGGCRAYWSFTIDLTQ
jgi:hypothetical protein